MALYSLNGAYPQPLPHRIRLSNGKTKTDNTTFTDSDLSDAGYTLVADAPDAPSSDFKVLEWDANNIQFVYRTIPNETEIEDKWRQVREQRDALLKEADIKTMLAVERGVSDPYVDIWKQKLRSIPEVNESPFNIDWPEYGILADSADNGE